LSATHGWCRAVPIRVLAPELVAKIVAGEVVERPASVVKELVENSLDAGATQVSVEIRGGGVGVIRVTDNGSGIPAEEVELAFQRHATSKIEKAEDLEAISSLGFRGEALASIAAVAQIEVFTQAKDEPAGTFISFKDGVVLEKTSRGRAPGTTITVRNLFHSVPARLKFLKPVPTENGHTLRVLSRYALAWPEVAFTLYLEGRPALRTTGDGGLREALAQVYGHELAASLVEVEAPGLSGLVGTPDVSRSGREYIQFFLQRRPIRSALLLRAVEEVYSGLLPPGHHPVAFLRLSVAPQEVDVNIHPQKAEVRFRDEWGLFRAVQDKLRKVLGQGPLPEAKAESPFPQLLPAPPDRLPLLRVLGQMAQSYIIAEGPEGLYLVDQHAAHERVLYEKIKARKDRETDVQGLLEPLLVELSPRQEGALRSREEDLRAFGFTMERFGPRTCRVTAVPALLKDKDIKAALLEILDAPAEDKAPWQERATFSLACHGAVKAGQSLTPDEMRGLLQELEKTANPYTCPHGRPTSLHFPSIQLERGFGRK
jgi:DNA mismatch repair protein MutL